MTARSRSAESFRPASHAYRLWLIAFCAASTLAVTSGCVQRRLLIRSDPPGAVVYMGHERVGITPCAVNYVYYGTRSIRLIKDGFETLEIDQPLPTPWYQVPPLDFVSDVLVPYEIRDVRSVTYRLQPQFMVPKEHLLARAEELRRNTREGLPPSGPPAMLQQPAPGSQTLPPSGQAVDLDELFPGAEDPGRLGPGAETLPPGGLEYAPPGGTR